MKYRYNITKENIQKFINTLDVNLIKKVLIYYLNTVISSFDPDDIPDESLLFNQLKNDIVIPLYKDIIKNNAYIINRQYQKGFIDIQIFIDKTNYFKNILNER